MPLFKKASLMGYKNVSGFREQAPLCLFSTFTGRTGPPFGWHVKAQSCDPSATAAKRWSPGTPLKEQGVGCWSKSA